MLIETLEDRRFLSASPAELPESLPEQANLVADLNQAQDPGFIAATATSAPLAVALIAAGPPQPT